jgi:TolB-like protein
MFRRYAAGPAVVQKGFRGDLNYEGSREIEGSMRDAANGVDVRLQLIDSQTSVQLWSGRLVINLADAADEAIHRVAGTIFRFFAV